MWRCTIIEIKNDVNYNVTICSVFYKKWCNKEEEQKAQEENREPIIIPHFSCHVFRHTFCTRFCENETNIKVIQEIMGHANISITMDIYAKATEEKKKQALDDLSGNLKIL